MNRAGVLWLALGAAGCVLVAGARRVDRPPRLLFNTTASAPVGFYWIDSASPRIGDLAVVRPPPALAEWMAQRRYLPVNVPLLKDVAAISGARVCGLDRSITIDGRRVAQARRRDRWGRPLRSFSGCRILGPAEVFLLNTRAPDSLDSRYFGPLKRSAIVGRARPLWTWAG